MRRAFTVIELIFVIVVLGILSAVALPKFKGMLGQADISKAKSTVTAIRSGLQVYKNKHILLGQDPYPATLDSDNDHLFDKVLPHAITPSIDPGGWSKENGNYVFHVDGEEKIVFTYDSTKGSFTCDPDQTTPAELCDQF